MSFHSLLRGRFLTRTKALKQEASRAGLQEIWPGPGPCVFCGETGETKKLFWKLVSKWNTCIVAWMHGETKREGTNRKTNRKTKRERERDIETETKETIGAQKKKTTDFHLRFAQTTACQSLQNAACWPKARHCSAKLRARTNSPDWARLWGQSNNVSCNRWTPRFTHFKWSEKDLHENAWPKNWALFLVQKSKRLFTGTSRYQPLMASNLGCQMKTWQKDVRENEERKGEMGREANGT